MIHDRPEPPVPTGAAPRGATTPSDERQSAPPPAGLGPEELPPAIELLLDDLAGHTDRVSELERALAEARTARADVTMAISPLMRGLTPGLRRRVETRLASLEARTDGEGGRVGRTRLTQAALTFLGEAEAEEIRASELTWYLRRLGFAVGPRYAPTLLRDWEGRGVVARTGRGVYRINRVHPEVFRLRLAALQKKAKML